MTVDKAMWCSSKTSGQGMFIYTVQVNRDPTITGNKLLKPSLVPINQLIQVRGKATRAAAGSRPDQPAHPRGRPERRRLPPGRASPASSPEAAKVGRWE